jgi:hypothetical protein
MEIEMEEKVDPSVSYTKAELKGLRVIDEALADKDKSQRMRMLHWAADKFVDCTLCHKP